MMYLAGDICKSRGEHERALEYFERGAAMNNGMCLREAAEYLSLIHISLKQVSSHTYLLESADNSNHWGRDSFLGYDPKIERFCKNHKMCIRDSY